MDGSGVRYRAPYGAKKDQTNWAIFIENFLGTSSLIITFFIFLASQNWICFNVYSFNSDYSRCTELNDALLYGGNIFRGQQRIYSWRQHTLFDRHLKCNWIHIFQHHRFMNHKCNHLLTFKSSSDCFSVKLAQSVFNLIPLSMGTW